MAEDSFTVEGQSFSSEGHRALKVIGALFG